MMELEPAGRGGRVGFALARADGVGEGKPGPIAASAPLPCPTDIERLRSAADRSRSRSRRSGTLGLERDESDERLEPFMAAVAVEALVEAETSTKLDEAGEAPMAC